tara:strand:- start:115 stop:351 length:237 start_codon:yes stop_codon:yes gene_type:complete
MFGSTAETTEKGYWGQKRDTVLKGLKTAGKVGLGLGAAVLAVGTADEYLAPLRQSMMEDRAASQAAMERALEAFGGAT